MDSEISLRDKIQRNFLGISLEDLKINMKNIKIRQLPIDMNIFSANSYVYVAENVRQDLSCEAGAKQLSLMVHFWYYQGTV
jgi:hypothetical protein